MLNWLKVRKVNTFCAFRQLTTLGSEDLCTTVESVNHIRFLSFEKKFQTRFSKNNNDTHHLMLFLK